MPVGDSPAPEPGETVKDQLMRTFSAVRSRLRAASHSAGSDGNDVATTGEVAGNGSHPGHTVGTMAPVDPLLAGDATGGAGDGYEAAARSDDVAVTWPESNGRPSDPTFDAIVETPPGEPAFVEAVPLVVPPPTEPASEAPDDEAAPQRPTDRRVVRARRQWSRPALPLLRRRPRVRKVTRIVRRVDAWGVFKISLIFYVVLYLILLVAGVLLWNLANTTGTVSNVEGFIRDLFGLKTFEFDGEKMFRASWVLGAILVVAGTGFNVTMAILFNLISDLVGGVRVTVLEEEVMLRERPVLPPAVAAHDAPPSDGEPSDEALAPPVSVVPVGGAGEPALDEPVEMPTAPADPLLADRPPRRSRPARPRRPAQVSARPSNGRVGADDAGRPAEPVAPTDAEGG